MRSKFQVVVDTDISLGTPGAEIDDGAALMMLINSPEVCLRGVSLVYGNIGLDHVRSNASHLLSLLEKTDIPLGLGAEKSLVDDPDFQESFNPWREKSYGSTPYFEPQNPLTNASKLYADLISQHPGEITLLALGPLTNLAIFAKAYPELVGQVRQVICMGGSFEENPTAEFNTRNDPEAAKIVFEAGWPLRLLGLNITRKILISPEAFRSLGEHPALQLLRDQALPWIETVREEGWEKDGCSLHDAAAVAAMLKPELFSFSPARIAVETAFGEQRGVTSVERLVGEADANVLVAYDVDQNAARDLVWSRVSTIK